MVSSPVEIKFLFFSPPERESVQREKRDRTRVQPNIQRAVYRSILIQYNIT